jgi:GAF domain-containing protein
MENAGGGGLLPKLRLDDLLAEPQTRLQAVLGTRDRMHRLLEAVAAAGVAVENARLYEEARRQQHWLRASSELTIALLSGADPARVLADLTRQVLALSGADLVTLALPHEDGRRLTLEYAEGDGAAEARGLVVPAGYSLSGQVLASGTPVTVENFAVDPRTADVTRLPMGHIGPAALFPARHAGQRARRAHRGAGPGQPAAPPGCRQRRRGLRRPGGCRA